MIEPTPHTRDRGAADVRPGAMTHAMRAVREASGERWLRWACVKDASIVREARIGPDASLTVGRDGDVDAPAIAGRAPLASFRDGRWVLSIHPSFTARIGERVIEGGDEPIELALDDDARGRVVIGEQVVLLQVVERPPVRKVAPLPPALRGGFFQRADWWFTAFVTGSFMLHFAFVAVVLEADWPIDRALIPESFHADIIFTPAPIPEDAPVEPMDDDGDTSSDDGGDQLADNRSDTTAPPSPRNPRRSSNPQPSLSDDEARELARRAFSTIGALMGEQDSGMRDLIDGRNMPSAGDLIRMAGEGVTVNGDPSVLAPREGSTSLCTGDGCLGDLRSLARNGRAGRQVEEGRPVEEVVLVVQPAPGGPDIEDPPPGFDTRVLIRALRARMRAVQSCFEREITNGNPDAGGRMVITMQVMPPGHLSGVHAEENETGSDALAACAVRSVATVRLPVGPSEPIEVRYPIVFQRRE